VERPESVSPSGKTSHGYEIDGMPEYLKVRRSVRDIGKSYAEVATA
jgi:hypothetical protein